MSSLSNNQSFFEQGGVILIKLKNKTPLLIFFIYTRKQSLKQNKLILQLLQI